MDDQSLSRLLQASPGATLLGREWIGFDEASQTTTLRFQARSEFANRHGSLQGGFIAAMLDSATGLALLATLGPGLTAVTVKLETEFLKPAPLGVLTTRARVVARDERDGMVEAELLDPRNQIVARATAKLRIIRRK